MLEYHLKNDDIRKPSPLSSRQRELGSDVAAAGPCLPRQSPSPPIDREQNWVVVIKVTVHVVLLQ